MRHVPTLIAWLIAATYAQSSTAACTKDEFEPDFSAATGAVLAGGTSQQRNFCDNAEDWLSFHVCPGRVYTLSTSALGPSADTLIELYAEDGTTMLAFDEDEEPDPTSHLTWTASSAQDGTLHARIVQRDGTPGDLRDYVIHLTGDTSPCKIDVRSISHVPFQSLQFDAIVGAVDGGFVTAGQLTSPSVLSDLAITRWNSAGTIAWIRTIGDSNSQGSRDLARTPDGGFVVAGYAAGADGLVVKLTDGGAVSWQRLYGGGFDDSLEGISASADGSIVGAGFVNSPSSGEDFDGWLVKVNASGTPIWSIVVGSTRDEWLFDVQSPDDGGTVAGGGVARPSGAVDALLLEVSAAGAVVKQTIFHTNAADTSFWAVHPLADGGYLAGGDYCTSDLVCAALLLKITAAGAVAWQRTLDFSDTTERIRSIDDLQDGSIYAHVSRSGGFDEPILTRWDPDGGLLSQISLGAVNGGYSGVVGDDGGIAVAYGGGPDARLARTDATGNVPYCEYVSPAGGVVGTPALAPSAGALVAGPLVETAPAANLPVTASTRSVATTCACPRELGTPIYVTGKVNTAISWTDTNYGPYDIVRGDLGTLKATAGDFTAALDAIPSNQQCLAQAYFGTLYFDSVSGPAPGAGYFYLVRGGDGGGVACATLYDETAYQLGYRDAEITAASGPCP